MRIPAPIAPIVYRGEAHSRGSERQADEYLEKGFILWPEI